MNLKSIEWTPELVAEYLNVAARTERALPPVYHKGPAGRRLNYVRTWIELLWDKLDDDKPAPKFQPTNEQVSEWEEIVLRWLPLVDSSTDKKILWLRACEMGWRRIGLKVGGLSRQTTSIRYRRALEDLTKSVIALYHKIA
jgi:hypothetical protein